MKIFDLEAAKRGEKIEYECHGEWLSAHFIGFSLQGDILIQSISGDNRPFITSISSLRMAPREMWAFPYMRKDSGGFFILSMSPLYDTEEFALNHASIDKARGKPQKILVDDES